ncbi:hypothetical protein RJ641_015789, partial [Dillenia turbinata]
MSSVCITKCVSDARILVRATYVNLYKWPLSDAREDTQQSGRGKDRVVYRSSGSGKKIRTKSKGGSGGEIIVGRRSFVVIRKVKQFTCAAFFTLFQRLLSCTATIDVIDARED